MQTKRKVSFLPTVTVHPVMKLCCNEDDKKRLYYSRDELNSIQCDAKAIIKAHRLKISCAVPEDKKHCIVGLDADYDLRGLELYLYPNRVINKVLTTNAIMKYQKTLNADSGMLENDKIRSLADLSSKLSKWTQAVALETARLDSIRSCGEDYPISIGEQVNAKRRRVTCDNVVTISSSS
jgi:hypothetical protein